MAKKPYFPIYLTHFVFVVAGFITDYPKLRQEVEEREYKEICGDNDFCRSSGSYVEGNKIHQQTIN